MRSPITNEVSLEGFVYVVESGCFHWGMEKCRLGDCIGGQSTWPRSLVGMGRLIEYDLHRIGGVEAL
jgi:hypothetical protein